MAALKDVKGDKAQGPDGFFMTFFLALLGGGGGQCFGLCSRVL